MENESTAAEAPLSVDLLDADDVADALGVSRWQIYRGAAAGQIPSVRLGRSVRFELDAVVAALRSGPVPRVARAASTAAPPVRRSRRERPRARTGATTQATPRQPDPAARLRNALEATSALRK